jgi:hypothetical protein
MLNSIIVIDGSQLARNSLEIILAGFGYKNVRGYHARPMSCPKSSTAR